MPRLLRPLRRRLRAFARARRGAVAVEFAFVAVPFIGLLAAIIETALAFFAGQTLDGAVSDAARQIYTGQFQASHPPAAAGSTTAQQATTTQQTLTAFKTAICNGRVAIFNCNAVKVDVLAVSDTASFSAPSPIDSTSKTWRSDFGTKYQNPQPNQIVIVQAAVEYPVFFSMVNPATLANGSRVLQSTVAFRTEPYQ